MANKRFFLATYAGTTMSGKYVFGNGFQIKHDGSFLNNESFLEFTKKQNNLLECAILNIFEFENETAYNQFREKQPENEKDND